MKNLEIFIQIYVFCFLVLNSKASLNEGSLNFRKESALLRNQRQNDMRHGEIMESQHVDRNQERERERERDTANININHVLDYLQTLRRSHEQLYMKIAELTQKLNARDQEDDIYTTKLSALENKVSILERAIPLNIPNTFQNTIPAERNVSKPKRERELNNFVDLEDNEDRYIPVNKIVEESRRSIEVFNSTLENIKLNISSMEDQFLKFNETHTNEIQTVVNMESEIGNKLESSCKEIGYLKMKHQELNFTVETLLNHFSALVNELHEENERVEKKVTEALESQKLATVEMRRQINGFKSAMKRQVQNISAVVGSWQKEDNSAISSLTNEVFALQEQINNCNSCLNDETKDTIKTKSLHGPVRNLPMADDYTDDIIAGIKQEVKLNRLQINNISAQLNKVNVSQILLLRTMDDETLKRRIRPKDCSEIRLFRNGSSSGVFTIYPGRNDQKPLEVNCDLETDGGGWTVVQRRGVDLTEKDEQREDFFRDWSDYEKGFGSIDKDFWLGLSNIAALCQLGTQELRIELSDWKGVNKYATYKSFRIADWSDHYRLSVSGYEGTAGDSFSRHNGMAFSTWDRDNDNDHRRNCAHSWRGAWWYMNCYESNLNGLYAKEGTNGTHEFGTGIIWYHWTDNYYSLKTVEMKIRNLYILQ